MKEEPTDSAETQELLRQARSGEPGALEQLFARYQTYLRRIIEMRLDTAIRRRLDASDVLQETQMEATRRLADYMKREPVPFRLWLRQIAHDRLLKARRMHVGTHQRSIAREIPLPDNSSLQLVRQLAASGSTPSQHIAKKELAGRVRRALGKLPDADREILLMRTFEKLSYEEIGYILGIEEAAANMRHVRALMRLSKILHDNGLTGSKI
jgi:RNA polymerase sigma-70 factor (ECF subfamily)